LTDNSLQSADRDQQEMRAVADKPHDAVAKFDTYHVQRHRAVLPAIARHLVIAGHCQSRLSCRFVVQQHTTWWFFVHKSDGVDDGPITEQL